MTAPLWRVRPARPSDEPILGSFTCAEASVKWQTEVEAWKRSLSLDWQGWRFSDGARASDVLMSAVMTDVRSRVPPRYARILAIVHEENARSIAMCHRHGITQQMSRPHPDYLRLITAPRS